MGLEDKTNSPSYQKKIPGELVGNSNEALVKLGSRTDKALLDTGSTVSTVSEQFYKNFLQDHTLHSIGSILQIESAAGDDLPYLGYIEAHLEIPQMNIQENTHLFLVVPETKFSSRVPILLGTNVLKPMMDVLKNKYGHYFKKSNLHPTWGLAFKCIAFQEKQISRTNGILGCIKFAGLKSIKIPSNCTVAIPGMIDGNLNHTSCSAILQPCSQLPNYLEVTPTLVQYTNSKSSNNIPVTISNLALHPAIISPKTILGQLEKVEIDHSNLVEENMSSVFPKNHTFLHKFDFSKSSVSKENQKELEALLLSWSDIFSHSDTDIGHVSIFKHKILLNDYTPFKQRHRQIPPSEYEELRQHLRQLEDAGVIRKSFSPWASNIVIVRKKDGSLRMCIDYRQLNTEEQLKILLHFHVSRKF